MSTTYTEPLARIEGGLDELAAIAPEFRTVSEKQQLLVGLSRVIARAQAEQLRLLATADDIAEATGDRTTASWLATATRDAHGRVRADARLAQALDQRWTQTAAALARAAVNLAQARVITEALEALPTDLGEDLLAKAETLMLTEATHLGPRELRTFGTRILEYLAPDIAEHADYQRLLDQERRAAAATRATLRRRGDGTTDLHARIPDLTASLLRTFLAAFTAPRRHQHNEGASGSDEFANLPITRQQGIAFVALLERILKTDLPRHGGKATSLVVLIDHDTLLADLTTAGIAQTTTGDKITAGQARRLACQAGLRAAVLGTKSEILDLGRESRLFNPAQRLAMEIRDQTCTEPACTMPAAYCEAHHPHPWSQGGHTNLHDGRLLCPFHHGRAHDPAWNVNYHPNGTTTFTRRQ